MPVALAGAKGNTGRIIEAVSIGEQYCVGAIAGVDPHQLVLHHQQGNDIAAYIQSDPIYAVQIIESRVALVVAGEHLFGGASPKGRRVLVQGTGSVGGTLIEYLYAAGAEVLFSEVDRGAIRRFRDKLGLQLAPAEAVYTMECDIFAPCALGGVLNANTIPQLKCRAVVGGANNQLAEAVDAERLQARGIFYAPDYVVNVGGAIFLLGVETQGWTQERAEKEVVESVRRALRQVFELAATEGVTTDAAARQIAEERLSAAQ